METRARILLLTALLLPLAGCASLHWPWRATRDAPRAEEPSPDRTKCRTTARRRRASSNPKWSAARSRSSRIDAENVEVGAYYGALSIEDFGTNPV